MEKGTKSIWTYFGEMNISLSLRERIPLVHIQPKSLNKREPTEGSIIIVKDDNLPRDNWRLGKILRLITSRDSKFDQQKYNYQETLLSRDQ